MKKLIVAAMLSMFAFTTAAYACDGMKNADHQSQASKEKSKDSKAKKESGADTTKS
jgi:hypothetical protein